MGDVKTLIPRGHMSGPARCTQCSHEWQAVCPIGTFSLECPNCRAQKGILRFHVLRSTDVWVCDCGNDLFQITPAGEYCINCGAWRVDGD